VQASPAPFSTSQAVENGTCVEKFGGLLISVDTDITPLLTHPDRQRSRKLLESCLREINYLMSSPTIPVNKSTNQEWRQQQYPQQQPQQQQQPQLQPPTPQPDQQLSVGVGQSEEVISYVPVDNNHRSPEDEELPRKLPRKVNLATTTAATDTSPLTLPKKEEFSWDSASTPLENKPSTVLERPLQQRHMAKTLFERKSLGEPRIFQHVQTLRSHLSPVRTLIACNSAPTLPDETCFISGGDDATIKFWRVSRTGNTTMGGGGTGVKKKGNFDVLPQITFRGHTGIVTCLAESLGNVWSAGSDGGIRGWKVPSASRDAYGSSSPLPFSRFERQLIIVDTATTTVLEGHTNCIWSLSVPGTQQPLLASAAADGTVKIWDTRLHSRSPLRASFKYPDREEKVNPTCVSWDWDGRGVIIGWENATVEMWDVEKCVATTKLLPSDSVGTISPFTL
jgi:striatin 1/3/4